MTNFLICVQTFNDSIKYRTNFLETSSYMRYYKFLEYIDKEIHLWDISSFIEELNKFKVIYIDLDTRTWKIIPMEESKDASFEELIQLNQPIEKEEESSLDKMKNKIFNISKNNKWKFNSNQMK